MPLIILISRPPLDSGSLQVLLLRLLHVELVHLAAVVDVELVHLAAVVGSTDLGSERLVRSPLGGLAGGNFFHHLIDLLESCKGRTVSNGDAVIQGDATH
jgi:hypothetical protein